MFCRCDCREVRVRWEEGGRGVRRARVPVWVVRRMREGWVGLVWEGGRRVRVEGKWPVWKVVWWRRWWPERDLGSVGWWLG